MQEEVEQKFGSDYLTIPTKEWIDLLGILDDRDYRRCTTREYQKPATYKKQNENPYDDD